MNVFRRVGMAIISTLLRWPLWIILALARPFVRWQTLFVVYPGDINDIKAYSPNSLMWLRNTWLFRGKPQFAGLQIRRGAKDERTFRGIIVYISSTIEELRHDKQLVLDIIRRLRFIGKLLDVQVIACAGQIPGVIQKHEIPIEAPFIDGRLGSSYSVIETVIKAYEKHNFKKQQQFLVVVGIGFLGRAVIQDLQELGYRAQGIDIVRTEAGVNIGSQALHALSTADVVVVLTPRGQDFVPYLEHLRAGAIIIDDTHPKLKHRPEQNPLYKVVLAWPGFESIPRLPGYKKQWIPGCMVEAIVNSRNTGGAFSSYQEFSSNARQAGIEVLLD